MTFQIIDRTKYKEQNLGKTRSEQEENIRKDGLQGMSDEQLDKCKFLEKKYGPAFWSERELNRV
jgi:hypothetical protein